MTASQRRTALPIAALSVAVLACGCGSEPTKRTSPLPAHELLLDSLEAHAADQVAVASVNGVPIYDRCVRTQAQAHELSPEAALQECIDFEILAQAANQPSYLRDRQVQDEGKQELVRAFVEAEYGMDSAEELPAALVRRLWERVKVPRYIHPELRDIVSCRIPLTPEQGPASPESQAAERFLNMLYEELEGETGLEKNDFFLACHGDLEADVTRWRKAGVHELLLQTFNLAPRERYAEELREAVFEGPETEGMVKPPLHGSYGWDLILLTSVRAELDKSFEDVEPELREALYEQPVYEPLRRELFDSWYQAIEKKMHVERFPENLPVEAPHASVVATDKSVAK